MGNLKNFTKILGTKQGLKAARTLGKLPWATATDRSPIKRLGRSEASFQILNADRRWWSSGWMGTRQGPGSERPHGRSARRGLPGSVLLDGDHPPPPESPTARVPARQTVRANRPGRAVLLHIRLFRSAFLGTAAAATQLVVSVDHSTHILVYTLSLCYYCVFHFSSTICNRDNFQKEEEDKCNRDVSSDTIWVQIFGWVQVQVYEIVIKIIFTTFKQRGRTRRILKIVQPKVLKSYNPPHAR